MAHFYLTAGYDFSDSVNMHDIVNYFVEKKGYVVGAKDKEGFRPITLTVLVQGATTDQLNQNMADLNWKMEQAERAYGPNGIGQPVIFWSKLGDNTAWTYWTVCGGDIVFEDVAVTDEYQMRAKLSLKVLPQATADPIPVPAFPASDSAHPIFIPYVKGDCSALGQLTIRNTGTVPIDSLWIARRGHRNLRLGGFKPYYALGGQQLLTADFQTLDTLDSPRGQFDSGIFDVVAAVIDGTKPLNAVTDLAATTQPGGTLLGGFYEYLITSIDAYNEESARGNIFDITVPTGSALILDPNPDPQQLMWGGPTFLGGTCLNPGTYSIDRPGVCVSTPDGLEITVQSDGWVLSNVTSQPLLIPSIPEAGNVSPTNKLPPKTGDLGYAYTIMPRSFPAPATGQAVFQYDLTVNSMTLGPLTSPIFFPQLAPFGLMRSPFGWAFYASSSSVSEDIDALVNDWKSDKLHYSLFDSSSFTDASFVGATNTVTIACDWRNGPLVGTLSINGLAVATLESDRTGAPASDVSLGVVVTNELPELGFAKIINPDRATWSYTKVQALSTSDSDSESQSNSDSKSTSSSNSNSQSNSKSTSSSDSSSHNESTSTSDSTSDSSSSSTSSNGSNSSDKGHSHADSTSDNPGGNSSSHSDGDNHGGSNSTGTSGGTSGSGSKSNSSSSSDGSSISHSSSQSNDDSFSDSTSDSQSNSNSDSHSTSTSHSETDPGNLQFDIPIASISQDVTYEGQVISTTTTKSKSTSTSNSDSSSTSTSESNSTSHSTSDSQSRSISSSDSHSTSNSSSQSKSQDKSGSSGNSFSDGSTASGGEDDQGGSSTSSTTTTSNSDTASGSQSTSTSNSDSHSSSDGSDSSESESSSRSASDSNSQSRSHSISASTSPSTSTDTSNSKSKSYQDVYLVQPRIDSNIPATGGKLASVSVLLKNVIVADGPIGTGAKVLLTWTPSENAANQRVYRIQNIGNGSPVDQWQYKDLGGTDHGFTDAGDAGWITADPPAGFSGPQPASFRLGYSSTGTDPLVFTDAVQPALSNGKPCFLRLATLVLPPSPRSEPESMVGPFHLAVQAETAAEALAQGAHAQVLGVWLLPQDEPQFRAETKTGDDTQFLEWRLDHRRDRRNSGRRYDLATGALVDSLKVRGDLTLAPGSNYLIILAAGPDGIADPNIQFTAELSYTPRTEFAFGLG